MCTGQPEATEQKLTEAICIGKPQARVTPDLVTVTDVPSNDSPQLASTPILLNPSDQNAGEV